MARKNGFSLIEMIVVVGIIGILAAAGIGAYNQMNMEFQVETEAKRIAVLLRSWQKDADSGVGSDTCGGATYNGIRVDFALTEVTSSKLCGATASLIDTIIFQNGITSSGTAQFEFMPVGGGATAGTRTFSKNGIEYIISVSTAGGIGVKKSP